MQSDDSFGEDSDIYTVSGDMDGEYSSLAGAFDAINDDTGSEYTITVAENDPDVSSFTLNKDYKKVTLRSSDGNLYVLTMTTGERHGTVHGSLTLENIILDGNKTGGGIVVKATAFLTVNDGATIRHCNINGNGGAVFSEGSFTINEGGTISGSKAAAGGGVYIEKGKFEMSGGSISDNEAVLGGGVYNKGVFALRNGTISGNSADNGGGVYNLRSTFSMNGGEISGNSAALDGGGLYNTESSTFNMSGNAAISGNKTLPSIKGDGGHGGGGVYNGNSSTFNMSGDAKITGNKATPGLDNPGYGGGVRNQWSTFNMTGGTISKNESGCAAGVYNYYDGTFNMSGGTITENKAIYFSGGSSFGGGVLNFYYSTFEMSGGIISFNDGRSYGGGLHNEGAATFIMKSGVMSNNTAIYGGGVFNFANGSKVIMTAGEISGNTAQRGGGIYNTKSGTTEITGGEICNNTAKSADGRGSGGGIYTEDFSKLTVKPTVKDGVVFSGNKAPTLRIFDISDIADIDVNSVSDLEEYNKNINDNVKLDAFVDRGQNAPAYNNYDINYRGDVKVVYVDIIPDGGGTVTVTYVTDKGTESKTFSAEGYMVVPAAVVSIKLSAVPEDGYEFVQFIINGDLKITDDSTEIQIPGSTTIIAVFATVTVPPENYIITATSDGGSTITPAGTVEVPHGEDKTFTFSPKKGHRITAVYVDDVAISKAELASGEYTFFNVESNHTIRVESKADNDNGGTGPGGNDTGPGGNEGSDPGGNDTGAEGDDGGSAESSKWSVLNLVCAIIAIFSGIIAIIAGRKRRRKEKDKNGTERSSRMDEDERKRSKTALIIRVLALIFGIVSVVVFFLTEDWKLPVVPMDGWTPLMFVLLLVTLALTMASFGFDEAPEEDAEDEKDSSAQGSG